MNEAAKQLKFPTKRLDELRLVEVDELEREGEIGDLVSNEIGRAHTAAAEGFFHDVSAVDEGSRTQAHELEITIPIGQWTR